jgi:hypothetical protein
VGMGRLCIFPNTAAPSRGRPLSSTEQAMTQTELNRAVARATGESLSRITSMGFVPLGPVAYEREPLVVNRDDADARSPELFPLRPLQRNLQRTVEFAAVAFQV